MLINELPKLMIRCLICTIIIELVFAIILGIKNKKDLINIILVNVLTNPIVVSLPIYILFKYNKEYSNIIFVILETMTFVVEGFIYKKNLKFKKINPFLISLILNLFSYFIGEIINKIL